MTYLLWLTSSVLSFVGAWCFRFVEDDPVRRHRRKLTRAGWIAFPIALLCVVLASIAEVRKANERAHEMAALQAQLAEMTDILREVRDQRTAAVVDHPDTPISPDWDAEHLASSTTWSVLVSLGEIKTVFARSADIKSSEFRSAPQGIAEAARRVEGNALATRIDAALIHLYGGQYDAGGAKQKALWELGDALARGTTVRELARLVDSNYVFPKRG